MSPYLRDYPRYAWQLFKGERAAGERLLAERRWNDIAPFQGERRTLRVLDLANGRLRPQ
jgi:hypothetical protein